MTSVVDIGIYQHRHGTSNDLGNLEHAELALVTDTGDIVMGSHETGQIANRSQYPYQNIQILTELSDNLNIVKYSFDGTVTATTKYPVLANGFAPPDSLVTTVPVGTTININGTNIVLTSVGQTISDVVAAINNANVFGVTASILPDNRVRITNSTGLDLVLTNVVNTPIQLLKFTSTINSSVTFSSSNTIVERPLKEYLDDQVSVKAFGATGNGVTDDSIAINAALLSLYGQNTTSVNRKKLYFPAGTYLINESLYIPSNAYLIGDGHDRTIIKKSNVSQSRLIGLLDSELIQNDQSTYGTGSSTQPENITLKDMAFEATIDSPIASLNGIKSFEAYNCRFTGLANGTYDVISITDRITFSSGGTVDRIILKDCIIQNGNYGVNFVAESNRAVFDNCQIENSKDYAFYINGNLVTMGQNKNVDVINSYVKDSGASGYTLIYVGILVDKISLLNNRYEPNLSVGIMKLANSTYRVDHMFDLGSIATMTQGILTLGNLNQWVSGDYQIESTNLARVRNGSLTTYIDGSTLTPTPQPLMKDSDTSDASVYFEVFAIDATTSAIVLNNASADTIRGKFWLRNTF